MAKENGSSEKVENGDGDVEVKMRGGGSGSGHEPTLLLVADWVTGRGEVNDGME